MVRVHEGMNLPWHIAHSESSLGWGGQEMRVMAELLGFRGRGCRVSLIAPRDSQVYLNAEKEGIPVLHLDTRKSRYPITAARISRWLVKHEVDILNTHSSRDGYVVGFAGRLARTPLVIRSRHIDVDYRNPGISRHAFTTLADHVLTTSDRIAAKLESVLGLSPERISTVTTGIDVNRFHPQAAAADLFPGGSGKSLPTIGMVSVLRSWKGHPHFIEAIRILHESGFPARYVIAGAGPMEDSIVKAAATLPSDVQLQFTGHRDDIPEVLRALDVLLIPSVKHEGVPQIGMQALAAETPVIGSAVGGIPEIIRDGQTGRIVPPEDPAALAAAIRDTLEHPAATATMAKRGREQAEKEHSLDHMLDRLEEIYRPLLGESAQSP